VTRLFVALLCLALALAAGSAHFTSAAFTASTDVPANSLGVDKIANHFSAVSAGAVQAGTSTPIASGNVDSLSLDFGTVPSARTFTNVFRVTNVGSSTATATMTLSPIAQIVSIAFASSGTTTATLAPGASTTVSVTTSSTVAGRGTGTLKLGVGGLSWMYRTYSVAIDEAPEVPGAPTATAGIGGRIALAWGASTTTTNLAGYDVYRSSGGGAYTKLTATPQTGLTHTDTATVDGTTYTYMIRATSSGTPTLQSLDSATATATADATPPGQPTSVSLANGGGAGGAYINSANSGSISVSVGLAANSLTSDVVSVTLSGGSGSVMKTAAGTNGAGTITVTGINASGLGDGGVTISVVSTDAAGNVSASQSATVTKDTAAPGTPSANYTDNNNSADQIFGTAEGNASVTATMTVGGSGAYTTTAAAGGSYAVTVATVNGKNNAPKTVTYVVTATDAAGNVSSGTTLTFADVR
jgi:HYDIN/CFA65/VesB-like, Ig-like domain